jgi:hypothetical protein
MAGIGPILCTEIRGRFTAMFAERGRDEWRELFADSDFSISSPATAFDTDAGAKP